MSFDIEETLKAADLPADVLPHLLWNEFILGTVKRRVFRNVVQVTDMLIGAIGTKISVPVLSGRFSASTATEAQVDAGYSPADPTITDVDITIGNVVYVAFRIGDILKEDQPKYDWIRILLRDAGRAIAEYEDASIRDVLVAGAGNVHPAATGGTLDYDDVIDCLKLMKDDSWFPDDVVPYLIMAPEQEADVVKDTRFLESHRYAVGNVADLAFATDMTGTRGLYAGCRVLVSDNMIDYASLVVMPSPHPSYGAVSVHAMKRPLTVKTERQEEYGRQFWVASTRYGTAVIQANGIGMISNC